MFAKVFEQIFDSSIAEDYQVRLVFEDMLTLADIDGVVDKTPEALARRTNVPIEIIKKAIAVLESPDPRSRRSEAEGRRLVRLDDHRDWGWLIVNYKYYRDIASEEQRRAKTRERVSKYREKTRCNAGVTPGNASPSPSTSSLPPFEGGSGGKPDKKIYGEMQKVKLTDEEYKKLIKVHGESDTMAAIEILDGYIASKGKRYQSHYATLKTGSWVWERVEEQKRKGQNDKQPKQAVPRKKAYNQADQEAFDFYVEQFNLMKSTGNESGIPDLYKKIRDNYGQEGIEIVKKRAKGQA